MKVFRLAARAALGIVAATIALGGCAPTDEVRQTASSASPGSASGLGSTPNRPALTAYFLHRPHADGGIGRVYAYLSDVLPNVKFRQKSGEFKALSDSVVLGKIVDIRPGDGFKLDDSPEPQSVRTAFSDKSASWTTALLTVDVSDRIGPGKPVPDKIEVVLGLTSSDELAKIKPELLDMEAVVLFLKSSGGLLQHYPGKYAILDNGELLTEVRSDSLSLPAKSARDPEAATTILSATPTLTSLKRAGAEPTQTRERPQPFTPLHDDSKEMD